MNGHLLVALMVIADNFSVEALSLVRLNLQWYCSYELSKDLEEEMLSISDSLAH